MNAIVNRFQVEELEQRLEMAEWTAKAETTYEVKQEAGKPTQSFKTSLSVEWKIK